MVQLVHKNYKVQKGFLKEDAENLYGALRYYGTDTILDAGYNMFNRDETPLHNNWNEDLEFLTCYYLFHKMAKNTTEDEFVKAILSLSIPSKASFDRDELAILKDKERYLEQALFLLGFLDSLSDYFDYEAVLLSYGYPCESYETYKKRKTG